MSSPDLPLLAATLPALILLIVVVFSLIAFDPKFSKSPFLSLSTKNSTYNDKDGSGLSKSANATWQRLAVFALSMATIALTIFNIVLVQAWRDQDIANDVRWLSAGWLAIAALATFFVICVNSRSRYHIGLSIFLATCPLVAIELYLTTSHDADSDPRKPGRHLTVTRQIQTGLGIVLAIVATSVRERPNLFRDGHPVNDSNSTSFLSRLTFSWAWPLLYDAKKRNRLESDDIPLLNQSMRSASLSARLIHSLGQGTKLWVPLLKDHAHLVFLEALIVVARSACLYVPSVALNKLLQILETGDLSDADKTSHAAPWAALMVAAAVVSVFLQSWDEWITWSLLDMSLTSQLYALIFHKCLRMEDSKKPDSPGTEDDEDDDGTSKDDGSESEDDDESNGHSKTNRNVMNLLGVDVERVSNFISQSSQLPCALLETIFGTVFLMSVLGWQSTLIGLSVPVLLYPLHRWSSIAYSNAEEKAMKVADEKTHKITEVLHAIKQIKFSASEDRWKSVVMAARIKELAVQKRAFWIETAMTLAWSSTPVLLGAAALSSYALLHGSLPASVAFTTISVLELLEFSISILPHSIVSFINARISMRRIEQHLERTEKQQYVTPHDRILFEDASLAWTLESTTQDEFFHLDHLDLEFPTHELSVITGMSGTGKSLMLAGLAGEAALLNGKLRAPCIDLFAREDQLGDSGGVWIVPSSKAFVAQSPWLENASITDNILFGLPHDQVRYDEVIHACALEDDLSALDDGHDTEVGALGINLSGGQRLRLTLARALYSRAEVLILDDVFSAVDAHVGRHILEHAILGNLCAKRTVIMATHHTELVVPHASFVVEVASRTAIGTKKEPEPRTVPSDDTDSTLAPSLEPPPVSNKAKNAPRKFVEEEARHIGAVKGEVYRRYMQAAGGPLYWIALVILFAMISAANFSSSYVIKLWTERSGVEERHIDRYTSEAHGDFLYLGLYVGIGVLSIGLITVQLYVLFLGSLAASKRLFSDMTDSVLAAPLRWIERVPTGRLLNRFVGDFAYVDSYLNSNIDSVLTDIAKLVTIIGSALIVSFWMALPAIGLLLLSFGVIVLYLPGALEVKRLCSNSRSPIMDFVSSVLAGLSTIRAFDKAEAHSRRMDSLIDAFTRLVFTRHLLSCWMNMCQGLLGVVFLASVLAFLLGSKANASMTGFVLSFAMSYAEAASWLVRQYASLEVDMNAVERVLEYTDISKESSDGQEPLPEWPTQGAISIQNLEVAYDGELPPVLKDVSFDVLPRERIGIVGRTGSGKSTLILALFRFLDQRKGSITIDGVDIATIPLYSLRKRLSLIPQDPVLFTGTLRSNLDPFGLFTDEDLLDVLRKVQHDTTGTTSETQESAANYPLGPSSDTGKALSDLDHAISRGGANVSQGQRQLICLARAMLEQPRVILLDEATSAVDFETDTLIQKNLRERFQESSLLVIAHRLGTIVDFDKVLVMGDGRVLEYGRPAELYAANGHFTGMVDQSGNREALMGDMGL